MANSCCNLLQIYYIYFINCLTKNCSKTFSRKFDIKKCKNQYLKNVRNWEIYKISLKLGSTQVNMLRVELLLLDELSLANLTFK